MPKNTKSAIVLLLGIVILAVAYFGAYSQYTNWGAVKAEHAISKEKNDKLVAAQSAANAFLAKYESNRARAEVANKVLPLGDADVPYLLGNFDQIADESGLTVRQIAVIEQPKNADEAVVPNAIKAVDLNVVVVGSYESFNNLLLRMQRNLRLVDLISVNVDIGGDEEDNSNGSVLEYTLVFRAYYQN